MSDAEYDTRDTAPMKCKPAPAPLPEEVAKAVGFVGGFIRHAECNA